MSVGFGQFSKIQQQIIHYQKLINYNKNLYGALTFLDYAISYQVCKTNPKKPEFKKYMKKVPLYLRLTTKEFGQAFADTYLAFQHPLTINYNFLGLHLNMDTIYRGEKSDLSKYIQLYKTLIININSLGSHLFKVLKSNPLLPKLDTPSKHNDYAFASAYYLLRQGKLAHQNKGKNKHKNTKKN